MEEILDEEYSYPNKEVVDKKKQYIQNRTIIYLTIMIVGGGLCVYGYLQNASSNTIQHLLVRSGMLMVIASGIEFLYQLAKLFIQPNKATQEKQHPFWFWWLEGSFTIWIVLVVIMIVGVYWRS